jgi:hypothetical protein
MAFLHSFAVIGIIVGYIVGAITVNNLGKYLTWRFAFMIQGWFMILIGFGFLITDNSAVDTFLKLKNE